MVKVISKVLDVNTTIIAKSEIKTQSTIRKDISSNQNFAVESQNVAFLTMPIEQKDVLLSATRSGDNVVIQRQRMKPNQVLVSIRLPFEAMSKDNASHITSFFYDKNSFFYTGVQLKRLVEGKTLEQTLLKKSVVFSASIANVSIRHLNNLYLYILRRTK